MQEYRLAQAEALNQSKQAQAMCLFSVHMKQCMAANAVCIFCIVYKAHPTVYMLSPACAKVPALLYKALAYVSVPG